jgi:hypothetical protein
VKNIVEQNHVLLSVKIASLDLNFLHYNDTIDSFSKIETKISQIKVTSSDFDSFSLEKINLLKAIETKNSQIKIASRDFNSSSLEKIDDVFDLSEIKEISRVEEAIE